MSRAGRFCCCCCCFLGVLWTLRSGSGKRFPGHEASEECKPGFSSTPLKTLPLSSPRAGQVLTLSLHYSIWTLTLQSRELNKPYPGHLLPGELCCVNSLLIQCVFKPRRFATTQTAGSHCWSRGDSGVCISTPSSNGVELRLRLSISTGKIPNLVQAHTMVPGKSALSRKVGWNKTTGIALSTSFLHQIHPRIKRATMAKEGVSTIWSFIYNI